jgi:hypothetical protein
MEWPRLFFVQPPQTPFQINSDLHLEVGQQYATFDIKPSAEYLILAGDIGKLIDYGDFRNCLQLQTQQFRRVFWVLGNHEFFGTVFKEGIKTARKLEKEPCMNGKLVLLHQTRYDIPNSQVTILGCTLWSQIPEESKKIVSNTVIDYKQIKGWTVDTNNTAFESDLSWLRDQVVAIQIENAAVKDNNSRRSILIVTHHAPCVAGTSSPQYAGNPCTCAFATDILGDGDWTGVKTWVHGHTHFTTEFEIRGVKVVSNQRGNVLPGSSRAVGTEVKVMNSKVQYDVQRVVRV